MPACAAPGGGGQRRLQHVAQKVVPRIWKSRIAGSLRLRHVNEPFERRNDGIAAALLRTPRVAGGPAVEQSEAPEGRVDRGICVPLASVCGLRVRTAGAVTTGWRWLILFVAALLFAAPSAGAQADVEFETRVVRVVSGDTVVVERDGAEVELRLADIGAPQGTQFLAPSSRTAVDGMVRNRAVRVQVTGVEDGVRLYGRLFAGQLDVARAQVRRGNAWVCWDYALDSELMPVENEAQRHRRGVWRSMMDVTSRSECRRRPPVPPPAEPKAPAKPN